jgi:chondroitin 4-sulfotransferase 11
MEEAIHCSGGNEGGITLGNYQNGHSKLEWYPLDMIDDYFKFSIVRNPWDRIFSVYKWNRNQEEDLNSKNFLKFLKENKDSRNETLLWHSGFMNQLDYLMHRNNVCMDYIIRFENLLSDFFDFKRRHPEIVISELTHTHRRESLPYTEYYNSESYDLVSNLFKKDIEHFGYKFQ